MEYTANADMFRGSGFCSSFPGDGSVTIHVGNDVRYELHEY